MADVDIGMIAGLFVLNAVRVWSMSGDFAGLKIPLQEAARDAQDNQRLRRGVAIPALPKRVNSTEGLG
jgi:hypothetical protein